MSVINTDDGDESELESILRQFSSNADSVTQLSDTCLTAYGFDNAEEAQTADNEHAEKSAVNRHQTRKTGFAHFGRIAAKTAIAVFAPLTCLLIVLVAADAVLCCGPSKTATGMFVTTVTETSAAKFLAHIFLDDDNVDRILTANAAIDSGSITDTQLVNIDDEKTEKQDITVIDIHAGTFSGELMTVSDPSRISLATLSEYGNNLVGKTVKKFVKQNKAVAGINAGGFDDYAGAGDGGLPVGLVISNGKLRYGSAKKSYTVIGFDIDDKLVVGTMTGREALDKHIRDAVSFGPILIVNGERAEVEGTGGGFNPRTCIGQKADGTVLLLVIDGRRPDSIGATYEDCIDILEEYGAVNAGNLDGGMSTIMYYNGKALNNSASLYGDRTMPTAFIVK